MLTQIHINQKLIKKFWGGCGQRWVWPVWSQDSKIDCISRMSWWNELIFCLLVQIQERESDFNEFWVNVVEIGCGHLVNETLKSAE